MGPANKSELLNSAISDLVVPVESAVPDTTLDSLKEVAKPSRLSQSLSEDTGASTAVDDVND